MPKRIYCTGAWLVSEKQPNGEGAWVVESIEGECFEDGKSVNVTEWVSTEDGLILVDEEEGGDDEGN